MNCLVITGRLLDPINRKGTSRSFKRYIIKTIEQGNQYILSTITMNSNIASFYFRDMNITR